MKTGLRTCNWIGASAVSATSVIPVWYLLDSDGNRDTIRRFFQAIKNARLIR